MERILIGSLVLICLINTIYAYSLFGGGNQQLAMIDTSQYYDRRPMTAYSFKAPFYLVRGTIPFWKFEGDTVVTDEFVRLTPAEKSRKGAIWSTKMHVFEAWEVELKFKIGSPSPVGADGMAFWYIAEQYREGPMYGAADKWNGLAIMFDTFDNDGSGDNPRIGAYFNDGTVSFGGKESDGRNELGGCRCVYRNVETHVKIQYFDGTVQISYKLNPNAEWTSCTQFKVNLPTGYYYGLSAETGGLSDNHDVYSFESFRLIQKTTASVPAPPVTQQFGAERTVENDRNSQFSAPRGIEETKEEEKKTSRYEALRDKLKKYDDKNTDQTGSKPIAQLSTDPIPPADELPGYIETPAPVEPPTPVTPPTPARKEPTRQAAPTMNQDAADLADDIHKVTSDLDSLAKNVAALTQTIRTISSQVDTMARTVATKNDNADLSTKLDGQITQIENVLRQANGANSNSNNKALEDKYNEIIRLVGSLERTVSGMRQGVDETKRSQQNLEQSVKRNAEEISSKVEGTSSSWGLWSLLILFQLCFGVAFMWWKKARDDSNKKLF